MSGITPVSGPQDVSQLEAIINGVIAQLNAQAGINSAKRINTQVGTTYAVTAANDGQIIVQNRATGTAFALPAASGSGLSFQIYVKTAISGGSNVISCTPLTDVMTGMAWVMSDNSQAVLGYFPGSTDNTLTMDGSTQGGYAGHLVQFKDVAPGIWSVESFGKATGTEATPFSHV